MNSLPFRDYHRTKIEKKIDHFNKGDFKRGFASEDMIETAETSYSIFNNAGVSFITLVDPTRDQVREYVKAFELYSKNAYRNFYKKFDSRSAYFSSIPSLFFSVLLYPIIKGRSHLKVGNEVECATGPGTKKDQDVAIYLVYDGRNIPIFTIELKDTYIDKTMLAGTIETAKETKRYYPFCRSFVAAPYVSGCKGYIEQYEKIGGGVFTYGMLRKRDYDKNFNIEALVDFYFEVKAFIDGVDAEEIIEVLKTPSPIRIELKDILDTLNISEVEYITEWVKRRVP